MSVDNQPEIDEGLSGAEGVKERNRKIKISVSQEKDLIAQIMRTQAGRSWMFQFLSQCHIFHAGVPTDALRMAYDEGERNVGLRIQSMIGFRDYMTMLEEQQENG